MSSHQSFSPPSAPFNPITNPYKAKRKWPPDFSKMDPRSQFRLERRYRRRMKGVYTRPGWQRGVKLAQFLGISGVLVYAVTALEWESGQANPLIAVRSWFNDRMDSVWGADARGQQPLQNEKNLK